MHKGLDLFFLVTGGIINISERTPEISKMWMNLRFGSTRVLP